MHTFMITADNTITVFGVRSEAKGGEAFTAKEELASIAARWPGGRLVEIWNSLPGVIPVNKFTNRTMAITRIWKAVQKLQPVARKAAPARDVATGRAAKAKANNKANRRKKASPDRQGARQDSKKANILDLLRRSAGATLEELMTATGWQAHSVRGFISGSITKKMGLKVKSSKREDGQRVYQIASSQL
jgi:hypothetical protein